MVAITSGSQTSSSITIRSTDTGTINAKLTYTLNGASVNPSVNINSVLPTLSSFTAQQGNTIVSPPGGCVSDPFWWFKLGCLPPQNIGIHFTTSVHAPTFISDPAQSGIKYVQAVSAFRKQISVGLRCITIRSEESNVESGWQRDGPDPYDPGDYPPRRFSAGNDLTMPTVDYPGGLLTVYGAYTFVSSMYVDDQFWMYVVYFAGDPATPVIQRPLGRLRWNWGGLVVFDWNGSNFIHNLRYPTASAMTRTGESTTSMVSMQGILSKSDVPCPGGPPLTENHVDSSRVLVREYYSKILGRSPDDSGWDWHTSQIAFIIWNSVSPYYQCRLELTKDGEIIPYSARAQRESDADAVPSGSGAPVTYEPGREHGPQVVSLDYWYEPLRPGRYQLTLGKQFAWGGDWVTSNPVYFEVLPPPRLAPIPAGVTLDLVPDGVEAKKDGTYELTNDAIISVFIRNDSEQAVKVGTVDFYYSVRPQLIRDKVLVPYRQETEQIVTSREQNPPHLAKESSLDPGTRTAVMYIRLKDWYGPLPAGSYRLLTRHRFEIDGPWTTESAPLLFEVLPY